MDEFQKMDKEYHFPMYRRLPITLIKGAGTNVWDSTGRKFIDALAGIAVNNVGHCHPRVVRAIQEQSTRLMHVTNIFYNDVQAKLAQKICEISGFEKVFFCNSGLEANEGAIKLVRKYGEKKGKKGSVVAFEGGFHGRSIASISMGKEKFQEGFGPLPAGFEILPYNDISIIEKVLGPDIKAVFIEAVQGEGGVRPADPLFMEILNELCNKYGILKVCDEIQTGMGRTGKMFGFQHYKFQPDIITLAKSLGGGFPIGAVLTSTGIASTFEYGDHGSTFGGNALACAAAYATLQVIEEDDLIRESEEKGNYLMRKMKYSLKNTPGVVEIRGKGLMIGIELDFPARPVVLNLLKRGIITNVTVNKTIRLVPPLIIDFKELDQIIEQIPKAINEEKNLRN